MRFGGLVIVLACALTAIGAGVAAGMPGAGGLQRVPHGLRSALFCLAGLVGGMILVAGVVAANPQSSAARTTSNGLPTVHVAGSDFVTNVMLVPKGAQLLLVADDSVEHIIANGAWTVSGPPKRTRSPARRPYAMSTSKVARRRSGRLATQASFTSTARSTAV